MSNAGVNLVGQAGDALKRIVELGGQYFRRWSPTSPLPQPSSPPGSAEINTGVNQLDEVTQQNAAMVEESTAASHSLRQEAESLTELVAKFRISSNGGADVLGFPSQTRAAAGPGFSSTRNGTGEGQTRRAASARPEPATSDGTPMQATGTDATGWEDF